MSLPDEEPDEDEEDELECVDEAEWSIWFWWWLWLWWLDVDEDDDDEDDDDEELPLPLFVVVPLVFPLLTCKATVDGVVEVDEGFIMFNGTAGLLPLLLSTLRLYGVMPTFSELTLELDDEEVELVEEVE